MATLKLDISNVGELFSQVASLSLESANPSAVLSRLGRVMTTQGEPTIGAMLETMAKLMLRAEENGETIALSSDHFAYMVSLSYDHAKLAADKGFCSLRAAGE